MRTFPLSRRQFAFWVGFGLFNAAEAIGSQRLDILAANLMGATDAESPAKAPSPPEHWTLAENNAWRWFEREHLIDGQWRHTGITRPVHKQTHELYHKHVGYLDEALVPASLRAAAERGDDLVESTSDRAHDSKAVEADAGQPSRLRRARHGRPPSRWLRSLKAEELRVWLKTIDVPEAGVEGMTFWEHLTRDHSFEPKRIAGLTEDEQAQLHAAAHYGY